MVMGSARLCETRTVGVLGWTRTVYLSGVSAASISWNVNDCTPSLAYASKQYLISAATNSRPLSGGTWCHLTPWRSLNVHTRWSGLDCHDSARAPLSVRSVGPLASSANA